MRLARETVINFAGSLITSLAGFVGTIVIARFLGPEALGIYSLVLALLFWLDIPVTGFQQAIMKRVSEGTDRATYFTTGLLTNAGLVAAIGGVILLSRTHVDAYLGAKLTPLLVALLAANAFFGTTLSGLKAQKRVGLSGLVRALERIVRTGTQLGLILLSYTVGGLVVGHVLSLVFASAVALWFYSFGIVRPRRYHLQNLYEYAKYAWASQLKGKAYGWLDTIVLGLFVGASLIGIYEVAWSLASTLVLVNKSIGQALFPELSELNEREDYDKIREHIEEALTFSGVVMIPGFVGAAIIGPQLLKIYGPEFSTGATILLILIFARMANSVGQNFYSAIYALDRPELAFRIAVPVMLLNLVLNLVLVSLVGWYGAAVATAMTGLVNLGLSYVVLSQIIGDIGIPGLELGKELIASVVMGGAVWGLEAALFESHYVTVGIVLIGATVYTAVLFGISGRFRTKVVRVAGSF